MRRFAIQWTDLKQEKRDEIIAELEAEIREAYIDIGLTDIDIFNIADRRASRINIIVEVQ